MSIWWKMLRDEIFANPQKLVMNPQSVRLALGPMSSRDGSHSHRMQRKYLERQVEVYASSRVEERSE